MPDNDDLLQRAENYLTGMLDSEDVETAILLTGFARAEIALDRKRVYDEVEQTINSFIEKLRAGTAAGGENEN